MGPDYVEPESPLQPAWLASERCALDTSPAELEAWWTRLGDPVLDELMRRALAGNNDIRLAGLRVLEAQARVNIATGNRYPQTQVLTGGIAATGISENSGEIGDSEFVDGNLGVSLSWEIDFWGRFRRAIDAADATLLASIASYQDVLVLVTAQVADTYALLRSTEEQLQLARDSVELQQRSFDIVEVLYRNGENSELDSLQAKTQLLGTRATIPGLQQTIRHSWGRGPPAGYSQGARGRRTRRPVAPASRRARRGTQGDRAERQCRCRHGQSVPEFQPRWPGRGGGLRE